MAHFHVAEGDGMRMAIKSCSFVCKSYSITCSYKMCGFIGKKSQIIVFSTFDQFEVKKKNIFAN